MDGTGNWMVLGIAGYLDCMAMLGSVTLLGSSQYWALGSGQWVVYLASWCPE